MNKNNKQGIIVDGSIRSAGVTFYTKQGQTIVRSATSRQPKRRTRNQFVQRQRLAHSMSIWFYIRDISSRMLSGRKNTYNCFMSMAAKLPPVYLTSYENACGMALLMPGIPVSCGTLTDIVYSLGSTGPSPALLTGLAPDDLHSRETLLLVTLRQLAEADMLMLGAEARNVDAADFTVVDGRLALVGDEFGDDHCGWALVRRRGALCSTQTVVTASTAYRAYQTDEALLRAAESYGGLTAP
ncbi:MAG: hypothetical protein IKP21_01875 [Bacteroidales bacterium]|nr:hypothetical protein [Bacteroidales bacterium]